MTSRTMVSTTREFNNVTRSIKFCHYKNGMFMGQMKCFQRSGKGLAILDNGEVALATYEKDKQHGETIVFTKNSHIYSLLFSHGHLVEMVGKIQNKLIYLKFKHHELDGPAIFIDFEDKQIFHLRYERGKIVGKSQESDESLSNRIFSHNVLSILIPINHLNALQFQFKCPNIQVIKRSNSITVGFYKNGLMNGLGFILHRNHDTKTLSYLEKGYYRNSQLCGIGQKKFQNGNIYIGEFIENTFNGRGLLINTQRDMWIKGLFKQGNMVDMTEYTNDGEWKDPKKAEMLSSLHKKKSSWVNSDIKLYEKQELDFFIQNTISLIKTYKGDGLLTFSERKQLVLKNILDNFLPNLNEQSPKIKRSSPSKKLVVKFSQDVEEKRTINSFQNFSDNNNQKVKLLPTVLKTEKRKRSSFKKNSRTLMNSRSRSPQSQRRSSQNRSISRSQSRVRQRLSFKKDQTPMKQLSRSTFLKPPLLNIEQTIRHSQNIEYSPIQTVTDRNNILISGQSQLGTMTKRSSVSASRRNRIFKDYEGRQLSSTRMKTQPSPLVESTYVQVNQDSPSPMNKNKKKSPRAKQTKSKMFQQDQIKQDQDLPMFRYSKYKVGEQSYQKQVKRRIF